MVNYHRFDSISILLFNATISDFQINGTDVSSFPHEDAVRAFLAAQEPIVVEIKRRIVDSSSDNRILQPNTVSIAVQTDICGSIWQEENVIDCPEIDLEVIR